MDNKVDPVTLEVLRLARNLVINEYTDRRAQDHNKWLADSDRLWRSSKIRLPYPTIPPYPTEKEIVDRAQTLLDFLQKNKFESVSTATVAVAAEETKVDVKPEEIKEPEEVKEPEQQSAPTQDTVVDSEPPREEEKQPPQPDNTAPSLDHKLTEFVTSETGREHIHYKVENRADEYTTTAGRILPRVLQKIEELRAGLPRR